MRSAYLRDACAVLTESVLSELDKLSADGGQEDHEATKSAVHALISGEKYAELAMRLMLLTKKRRRDLQPAVG